jgi:hypothetical protein
MKRSELIRTVEVAIEALKKGGAGTADALNDALVALERAKDRRDDFATYLRAARHKWSCAIEGDTKGGKRSRHALESTYREVCEKFELRISIELWRHLLGRPAIARETDKPFGVDKWEN